jgi:hypothetical protein
LSARGSSSSSPISPPLLGQPERTRRPIELWAGLAYFAAACYALLLLYLFLRPGGVGPVVAYNVGRPMVELVALVTLAFGLVWCALHRPFYQRRRLVPFACVALVIGAAALPLPYPSSHADEPSQVRFRLPFEGEWTVFWGGESSAESRLSAYFADRRWGLDFIVTENGASHSGSGLTPKDYFVYERDVLAPADGTVVRVNADLADSRPGIYDSRLPEFGNYVVIEVAPGEFAFLCHLLAGSIPVTAGDKIRAGDLVGRVGNSGYSTVTPQPHLSIHLQDSPEPERGEAIPWRFCDYMSGGVQVECGLPRGGVDRDGNFLGQRVQPVPVSGR